MSKDFKILTSIPDLLEGAEQIAFFLFEDARRVRTVYHLARQAKLPTFRMGGTLCARRSTLSAWIAEQERTALSARGAA